MKESTYNITFDKQRHVGGNFMLYELKKFHFIIEQNEKKMIALLAIVVDEILHKRILFSELCQYIFNVQSKEL